MVDHSEGSSPGTFEKIWISIGTAIGKYVVPPVVTALREEIQKQMPEMLKGVVAAMLTTGTTLLQTTTDEITDLIPGDVDDAIVDPIVSRVMDWLNRFRPQ